MKDASPRAEKPGRRPVVVAFVVIALTGATVVLSVPRQQYAHHVPLREHRRFASEHPGQAFRVSGTIARKSFERSPKLVTFALEEEGETLRVGIRRIHSSTGAVLLPDNFRDDGRANATVEGTYDPGTGLFEAELVMISSGGPYEMKERAVRGKYLGR